MDASVLREWRASNNKKHWQKAVTILESRNLSVANIATKIERAEGNMLPCDEALRRWHRTYGPTFSRSFEISSQRMIDRDLAPFFGTKDLREIDEEALLDFVRAKLEAGLSPRTIETTLSVLRRVLSIANRRGEIARNPALRLGEIMRRVDRRAATEVEQTQAWTREEVATLLALARKHDSRFAPLLRFLLATGARRGEALGLKWEDVDFERVRITIRRAYVVGELTTPKSGKARSVAMPPALAAELFDLLAQRRVETVRRGWGAVPDLVFPSETGGPIHHANLERSWIRLRRKAQAFGVPGH